MTDKLGRFGDNLKSLWKSLSVWFVSVAVAVQTGLISLPPFVSDALMEHKSIAAVIWFATFLLAKATPQGGLFK